MEAPGDLELSADAGHAVKLRVVSAPERRDLDLARVRMREGRVIVSCVGRGQRQQRPGGRQHPRPGQWELCEALFRVRGF